MMIARPLIVAVAVSVGVASVGMLLASRAASSQAEEPGKPREQVPELEPVEPAVPAGPPSGVPLLDGGAA